jgi:hypothetical protein
MATITVTFHTEDAVQNCDLTQFGTVTSRTAPSPTTGYPTGRGGGGSAGEGPGPRSHGEVFDPKLRQTVVVINSGAITLAEVQRALKAAKVPATAV